jgi:hypothetical protein
MKIPMEAVFKLSLEDLRLLEQRLLIKDGSSLLSAVTLLEEFASAVPEWSDIALDIRRWLVSNGMPLTQETLHAAARFLQEGVINVDFVAAQVELNLRYLISEAKEAHDKAKIVLSVANDLKEVLEAQFRQAVDQGFHLDWQELKRLKDEIHV